MLKLYQLGLGFALLSVAIGCTTAVTPPKNATAGPVSTQNVGQGLLGLAAAGGYLYCGGTGFVDLFNTVDVKRLKGLDIRNSANCLVRTFIDRRQVLVHDGSAGALSVIDAAAEDPKPEKVGRVLQTLPVPLGAASLSLGEDNQTFAVAGGVSDTVVSFFFQENREIAPSRTDWKVGAPAPDHRARPIDWKNAKLLTIDFTSNELKLFDGEHLAGLKLTRLEQPGPVGIGTDLGKAVIKEGSSEGVAIAALALDKGRDALVLSNLNGTDTKSFTDLGKGIGQLLLDPANSRAWVTFYDSDEVAAVDYRDKVVVGRIPVCHHPVAIALAPPVEGEVWVAGADGALTIINGSKARPDVKTTLNIGTGDHRMTFWGTKGYVSNAADGTLSIVDRVSIR